MRAFKPLKVTGEEGFPGHSTPINDEPVCDCCALAIVDHAAAPPTKVTNSRRFMMAPKRDAPF